MGLIVRQSILNTLISYAGVVIGYINLLYLYPRILAPEQIGTIRTLQDSALLFAPFAQLGIVQSIQRYFPRFGQDQRQAGAFMSLMLTTAVSGFVLFAILFAGFHEQIASYFEEKASDFVEYLGLTLWLTLILVVTAVMESYSRALLKTTVPGLLRELVVRVLLSVFVLLYAMGYLTFPQFVMTTLIAYLFCLSVLLLYLYRSGDLRLTFTWQSMGRIDRREMLRYSLFGFAGTAGMIIIGKVDSLMVAGLVGLAANAVYTTAFYMATVIEIPKRAMTQVASPLIARALEKNDLAEVDKLYHKTALNQFIIGTLLLIGILANLDSLFYFMPKGDVYAAGKWVVLLVGAGKLADMLFGPSSEIIVYSKYYTFNLVLIILLATGVVTANNILIPAYGINGAAAGAALTMIAFNAVKYFFIWAKLGLQPFTWNFSKVLAIGAVTWAASMLLPRFDGVLADILLRSSLMLAVYGFLVLGLKISPEVNAMVNRVVWPLLTNRK